MNEWIQNVAVIDHLHWITLDTPVQWKDVDNSSRILMNIGRFDKDNHQALYVAFESLRSFATKEVCDEWKHKKTAVDQRWVEFFTHIEGKVKYDVLSDIVAYGICIPGKEYAFHFKKDS